MSGFAGPGKRQDDVTKVPGKQSGVTADDFAGAGPQPGKRNLVQGWETGVAYSDKGPKCEADPSGPGCFMTDRQRDHLDLLIAQRVQTAQNNYKLALSELRVDRLMEKSDDLNWLVGVLFDAAGAYFAGTVSKALIKLKSTPVPDAAVFGFEETPDASAAAKAFRRVSDSSITSLTKKGLDFATKKEKKAVQNADNAADEAEKAQALSFIELLKVQCDVMFDKFISNVLASADDAQRVVIYNGLAPQYHSEPLYKVAIAAKIKRFEKSGVADVGQKAIGPAEQKVTQLYASKKVIRVREPSGVVSVWAYRVISGSQDNPWMDHGANYDFERVPDEFVDAALALSEQKWGPVETIDDPAAKKPVPQLQLRDPSRKTT